MTSLNTRVSLLLGGLAAVLALVIASSFHSASRVERDVLEVQLQHRPGLMSSRQLVDSFQSIVDRYEDAAMTGERALLERNIEASRDFLAEVRDPTGPLRGLEDLRSRLRRGFTRFDADARELTDLMLRIGTAAGDDSEPLYDRIAILGTATGKQRDSIAVELGHLVEHHQSRLDAALTQVHSEAVWQSRLALAVGLGCLCIWVATYRYVRWRIVGPIQTLSRLTTRVASGDLHHEVDPSHLNNDEIGQLARDFQAMIHGLERTTLSKNYIDDIIRSMAGSLIVVDGDNIIRRVNDGTLALLGYAVGDLEGHDLAELFPDAETLLSSMRSARDRGLHTSRNTYRTADGSSLPVALQASLLRSTNGQAGAVLVAQDIRAELAADEQRRGLEHQLYQSSRLESVGQLAAGIAHEINTPMQYIGDNTRFVADALTSLRSVMTTVGTLADACRQSGTHEAAVAAFDKAIADTDLSYLLDESTGAVEQSIEGIDRVTEIVRAMKEFSHPGADRRTQLDLNRALRNAAAVSRNEWKLVAEVEFDLDPNLATVSCLAGPLNQALLNIIVNAAHAIAGTDAAKAGAMGRIGLHTHSDQGVVEIRISDTGGGIPAAIQSRVLEPFFTTKGVGKGTGQGLAIARSVVVDKHGGTLEFTSTAGVGTTFVIRLPIVQAEPAIDAGIDAGLGSGVGEPEKFLSPV